MARVPADPTIADAWNVLADRLRDRHMNDIEIEERRRIFFTGAGVAASLIGNLQDSFPEDAVLKALGDGGKWLYKSRMTKAKIQAIKRECNGDFIRDCEGRDRGNEVAS